MEVSEHLAALDREGPRLAGAAEAAGLDAVVPTCPEWTVRDLVAHLGGVHRWAALVVSQRLDRSPTQDETTGCFAAPEDAQLVDWFRAGHAALVRTLAEADPALECWSFLRAPSPLAFWARRQAHETTIHRVDAESATGAFTGCDPAFATDGVEELLMGFLARPRGRLVADPPVSVGVRTTDTAQAWQVRIEPDRREVTAGVADPAVDCEVAGPAELLYRFLWNRAGTDGLDVRGDRTVLELWRAKARILWT